MSDAADLTEMTDVVNVAAKLEQIADHWSPRIVARVNDADVKLARLHGEFVWHHHPDTDELFLVVKGELVVNFPDRSVTLREGELLVVPRGVEHQPVAEVEAEVLLIELCGTRNTGTAGGPLTRDATPL